MRKAAIIPSKGIGDCLIMMILANHLQKMGYECHLFHNTSFSLQNSFPNVHWHKDTSVLKEYNNFDLLFLQNDNSVFSKELISLRLSNLSTLYSSYKKEKHGELTSNDYIFNKKINMAENTYRFCRDHLKTTPATKDLSLSIPPSYSYRKHEKRIIIHPTSSDKKKNWPIKKYHNIAKTLKDKGFNPVFSLSSLERKNYLFLEKDFEMPLFPTLSNLVNYIYESGYFIGNDSGPAHIASCINIPSLLIASSREQMSLWQPGWRKADIIYPSKNLINIKGLRLKDNKWSFFISKSKVLKVFDNLINKTK